MNQPIDQFGNAAKMHKPGEKTKTNFGALTTLVTVFFFWGFVAASNGIFIPFCKAHFSLNQYQSQLIDASFYGAYFFGSLILYMLSTFRNIDLLNQIGYKKGIISWCHGYFSFLSALKKYFWDIGACFSSPQNAQ